MGPFALLGLDGDAEEAQVKRAYAKRLRSTRPDDDPAGFQRLHEAYQAALQSCRLRAGPALCPEAAPPRETEPQPAPASAGPSRPHARAARLVEPADTQAPPAPAGPPPLPETAFATWTDPADTLAAILSTIPSLQAPTSWLHACEPLYSLAHKQAVAELLVSRLENDETVSLPNHCLDALLAFFDIRNGVHLRRKVEARHAILRENTTAFGEHNPLLVRQLKRKLGPKSLLLACVPGIPGRASRLGMRLQHGLGYWPAGLDAAQMRFFTSLARPDYWGIWRWTTIALAALATGLAWGALLALVSAGNSPWGLYLLVPAVIAGALLGWHGFVWLQHLMQRGHGSDRWFLAQLPAELALAGLLLGLGLAGSPASPLAAAVSIIAAMLVWRLKFTTVRFVLSGFMIHTALGLDGQVLSRYVLGPAMGPLGLLLFDALHAWKQRIPLAAASGNLWTSTASYIVMLLSFGAMTSSYKGVLGILLIGTIVFLAPGNRKRT